MINEKPMPGRWKTVINYIITLWYGALRARLGFNCPDQPPLGGSPHTLPMGFVPAEPRAVLAVLLPSLSPGSIPALQAAHLPNGDVCTAASLFHPDWCPAGPWLWFTPCHVWGCRECCWQLCLPCLHPPSWLLRYCPGQKTAKYQVLTESKYTTSGTLKEREGSFSGHFL